MQWGNDDQHCSLSSETTAMLQTKQLRQCHWRHRDEHIDICWLRSWLRRVKIHTRFTVWCKCTCHVLPPPLSLSLFLFLSLYLSIYLSVYFPLLLNTGYLRFSTSMCIFIVARFYYPLPIDYTLIKILSYGLAQKYKSSRNQILFH